MVKSFCALFAFYFPVKNAFKFKHRAIDKLKSICLEGLSSRNIFLVEAHGNLRSLNRLEPFNRVNSQSDHILIGFMIQFCSLIFTR